MEIVALLGGLLAAIVFVAERLAFAVMLWLLCAWVWRVTAVPRALLVKALRWMTTEMLIVVGQLKWVREAVQFWWMSRSLRRQFAMGATP
jgi:hypothetical protein